MLNCVLARGRGGRGTGRGGDGGGAGGGGARSAAPPGGGRKGRYMCVDGAAGLAWGKGLGLGVGFAGGALAQAGSSGENVAIQALYRPMPQKSFPTALAESAPPPSGGGG